MSCTELNWAHVDRTLCQLEHARWEESETDVFPPGFDFRTIDVYSVPGLTHVCTVQVHKKLINALRWHPHFTAQSEDSLPRRSWLAIGSNETHVSVVDLQNVIGMYSRRVLCDFTCCLVRMQAVCQGGGTVSVVRKTRLICRWWGGGRK